MGYKFVLLYYIICNLFYIVLNVNTNRNCEGAPIRSLFTLLLWHILFPVSSTATAAEVLLNNEEVSFPSCIVTGAFLTPYQDAPLDLESPQFYANRKNMIERCCVRNILL